MKIAYASGRGACRDLAGDTIQMLKTREFLLDQPDVTVDILTNPNELNTTYDLLHLFNLPYSEGCFQYVEKADRLHIKTAISTIYWDFAYSKGVEICNRIGLGQPCYHPQLLRFLNWLYVNSPLNNASFLNKKKMAMCIEKSQLLLPNSHAETQKLAEFLGYSVDALTEKSVVVPNAVDANIFRKSEELKETFFKKYNLKDFVLSVGKISPNKNQLSVIQALFDHPEIPIVLVGVSISSTEHYFSQIKALAERRGNVYFFGNIQPDELGKFYNAAAVHILPSFRESPGLVSIEAALCGCEIVVSEERFCPSTEYFGDMAHYCFPYDKSSIRSAVLDACRNKKNDQAFRTRILNNYLWRNTAVATMAAYKRMLRG